MLDHISLGVSDLAHAAAFYDAILQPLGYRRLWTRAHAAGFGEAGRAERFALFEVGDDASAPGRGWHLAFAAPSRQAVLDFHAAALARGALDEGAPGARPRSFAAFVRDPDGHKIEAVFHEG